MNTSGGKARSLRKEAKALLAVSKDALRYLLRQPIPSLQSEADSRLSLMSKLSTVIERADPPSRAEELLSSFQLTMTNPTANELLHHLRELAALNEDDGFVLETVEEGLRRTKQRVYLRLPFNPSMLRRLRYILNSRTAGLQDKAFRRLAKEIEADGLSKNPMEILARMGL